MHELTICYNIVKLVEKATDSPIKRLWIDIGELSGIDTSAIQFSFPIAAKNSCVEHSELVINEIQGVASCNVCQKDFNLNSLLMACPLCFRYDYEIKQGQELRILEMEKV